MTLEKIGRYEIKSQLGKGGMATVYLALDALIDREVAIKVLPREFLHDHTFRDRFEREARTIARLEHPAIVPVYDFGEEEGQPYLVMRYMKGQTLAERIAQEPLPVAETAEIVEKLAAALDHAHAHGVIHRDLKPANILFDGYGQPYLSDFGIVKLAQATANLTGEALVGTPAYMSPEQVKGEGEVDGRSDIYSLGVIVFEMLAGQPPYEADSPTGLMMAHLLNPIPRILDARPDLPYRCNTIINRAMAKDPDNRFESATALWQALQKAADEMSAETAAAGPTAAALAFQEEILENELDEAVAEADAALTGAEAIDDPPPLEEADPLVERKTPAGPPPSPRPEALPAGRQPSPAPSRDAPSPQAPERLRQVLVPLLAGSGGLALCCLGLFAFFFFSGPDEQVPWATVAAGGTDSGVSDGSGESTRRGTGSGSGLTTRMARAAATATAQQELAIAASTATAQAAAAATATMEAESEIATQAVLALRQGDPLSGPLEDELDHALDGFIKSDYAGVEVRDFLAEATFTNPYPVSEGTWDVGFMFREDAINSQYRLALQSDGEWTLTNREDEVNALIQEGAVANLDTEEGGRNKLVVVAEGPTGYFFLNERYVATLDLSARQVAGDVAVATSMYEGNEIEGEVTAYEAFALWAPTAE